MGEGVFLLGLFSFIFFLVFLTSRNLVLWTINMQASFGKPFSTARNDEKLGYRTGSRSSLHRLPPSPASTTAEGASTHTPQRLTLGGARWAARRDVRHHAAARSHLCARGVCWGVTCRGEGCWAGDAGARGAYKQYLQETKKQAKKQFQFHPPLYGLAQNVATSK